MKRKYEYVYEYYFLHLNIFTQGHLFDYRNVTWKMMDIAASTASIAASIFKLSNFSGRTGTAMIICIIFCNFIYVNFTIELVGSEWTNALG